MKPLALVLAAAAVAAGAQAAPFQADRIPGDVRWVVHFDVDLLKATAVGQHVMAEMSNPTNARKMAALDVMFHFDPRRDLSSMTLFGVDKDERKSVVVADGAFDTKHLAVILGASEDYEQSAYQGDTLHAWVDVKPGKRMRMFGCILSDKQVVIGQDKSAVTRAIDTLRGRKPGLAGSPLGALMPSSLPAVVTASADLRALQGKEAASGIMQNAQGGALVLGEAGGEVTLAVAVDTASPEKAKQVNLVLMGIGALGQLGEKDNPDFAALCRAASATVDDTRVSLRLALPAADVIRMMKQDQLKKLDVDLNTGLPKNK